MTLPTLDTHEFTRRGDSIRGDVRVADLSRLVTLLADPSGTIAWQLSGRSVLGVDGSRTPYLDLGFSGMVRMHCVRCLEPVVVALDERRAYRLVATEDQAEREDPDEDEFDLLVSSRRFEFGPLLEDEAIMALPAAPSHRDCRAPEPSAGPPGALEAAPARPNPFAALDTLRGGAGPAGGVGAQPADGSGAAPDEAGTAAPGAQDPERRGR